MEELLHISKQFLDSRNESVENVALALAEWAMPGQKFVKEELQFSPSGLPLSPFVELLYHVKEI